MPGEIHKVRPPELNTDKLSCTETYEEHFNGKLIINTHTVTCMRFHWFNNVSSATTMEQYNTCVSLVTQTILGD
jgi:hypothetical protein